MGINTHGKMVFILKWGPDALPLESIPQPYIQKKKKKLLSQWTDWCLSIYINKTILITEKKIFEEYLTPQGFLSMTQTCILITWTVITPFIA